MTITLYANCKLTQDKNFAVDDISDYLATFSTADVLVETDLNYFKHKKETFILLDLGQSALNYYNKRFNFCKIQNGTDKAVYYFITNLEWRSKQVIYLTLYQDTISTWGILPLTDKTLVHREHKDRYNRASATAAYCKIDKVSEGLSLVLFKDSEKNIANKMVYNNIGANNSRWYIAYFNNNEIDPTDYNQVNPVNMFLFADKKVTIKEGMDTSYTITAAMGEIIFAPIPLKNGMGNQYVNYEIYLDNDNILPVKCTYNEVNGNLYAYCVKLKRLGSSIEYISIILEYDCEMTLTASYVLTTSTVAVTSVTIRDTTAYTYVYKCNTNDIYNEGAYYTAKATYNETYCDSFASINRTDSRIIKIIELPYCPLWQRDKDHFYNNIWIKKCFNTGLNNTLQGITFRPNGNFKEDFFNEISFSDINPYPNTIKINPSNLSKAALKNKAYEPKLFNSEIYNLNVVYDSFSSRVDLEKIDYDNTTAGVTSFVFDFIASSNISSKFIIDYKKTFDVKGVENYENIIIVNRNNEAPIFSSQYLNYIRNGYNYDVKAKENKIIQQTASAGIGIAGSAAAIVGGLIAENPAIIAGGVMGLVTSISSSAVTTISSAISSQQAIDQKLAQAKAQANSVQTADDLSLLDYYTKNNKAKLCYYKPSEAMENNIYNLFYYLGYKSEQMKKPSLNSRLRFNFIQADIDIDFNAITTNTMNMTKEIIDDYKGRFAVGLTLFHYFNNEFDFEQKYENWESVFENDLTA